MYLTQAVHRAVQQTPDLPATIGDGHVRSWSESADRIARFAAGLTALGTSTDDRVALLGINSDTYHEALLAIVWADAVMVPVNTRWSPTEIAFSLRDAGCRTLIVDATFAGLTAEILAETPDVETVVVAGGDGPDGAHDLEVLIARHQPAVDARRGGDALAGIFYTGGTTGRPKGVMLSHANLVTNALGMLAPGPFTPPGGRTLHAAPMFHLAALAAWIARTFTGGTHLFVPSFTPLAVARAVEEHRVTDILLVPTMIQMLVDAPEASDADLSSLRYLVYGASTISDAVLGRAARRLPGVRFVQAYGMTELSPVATLLSPEDHDRPELLRSAGRAAPHCEVRIVDEQDHEVARGTVGEIVARGGNVMLGYWDRPEETDAALRGGWMHTGDGGYMDAHGYVFIADRIKDMIVTGGENVYSAEVENALAQHPGVVSCAVIGIPDPDWGETVHAVVVPAPGTRPTVEELRSHTKTLIAGYKAPRSVELVDALPLSAAGKVLKRELRARHRDTPSERG